MKELEDEIRSILIGIDKDGVSSDDGWWETSTGAEFGKAKLEELLQAIRKYVE